MKLLKKINSAALALNLNLLAIVLSLKNLPKYFSDRNRFIKYLDLKKWSFRSYPMLLDNKSEAASLGEYFWQDLFIAKKIIKKNPIKHIDIGSRIDGFIAHLACVRQVEIFDIRPLTRKIENVNDPINRFTFDGTAYFSEYDTDEVIQFGDDSEKD